MSELPVRQAYLVSQYPAASHTFILREVRTLRALGIEIHVASINAPDRPQAALSAEEREEAATTYYVKAHGVRGAARAHAEMLLADPVHYLRGLWFACRLGGWDVRRVLFGALYFVEAVMVGRWAERHRLRHLHVHFATAASTVALVLSKTFPITISITVHGPDEFDDVRGHHLREKVRSARFVSCISMYARSQLMKVSAPDDWHKLEVARLGVDGDRFGPAPFRADPRPFEILTVARLVPAKGHRILFAAIEALVSRGCDVRLRLIGDGPDRVELESAVGRHLAGRIRFEGTVDQDHIRDFYRQADLFVLASVAEGVPVVLMEAMAMEIACVATTVAGISELIRSGVDGVLVPPSDVAALVGAIEALMTDPDRRRRMGQRARERVQALYDLRSNTARFAGIVRRRLREAA